MMLRLKYFPDGTCMKSTNLLLFKANIFAQLEAILKIMVNTGLFKEFATFCGKALTIRLQTLWIALYLCEIICEIMRLTKMLSIWFYLTLVEPDCIDNRLHGRIKIRRLVHDYRTFPCMKNKVRLYRVFLKIITTNFR